MGFQIKVDGNVVKEIDVDPFLVNAVIINGLHKVPVAGASPELGLDLTLDYKPPTDGDVVARLRNQAAVDLETELGYPERVLTDEEREAEDKEIARLEELGKGQEDSDEARDDLSVATEDEDIQNADVPHESYIEPDANAQTPSPEEVPDFSFDSGTEKTES